MGDREKVVKGLEYHLKELSAGKTCFDCPYWGDNPCEIQLVADALALLKEQEPASPTWEQGKAYCGKCGQRLPRKKADREINYCCYCGQAVKWE